MLSGLWAIIYKEFLQVRRDPATRFVMLFPVMQIMIFGFAIDTDVQHIRTAVCDLDGTVETRRIVERFESSGTFVITAHTVSPEVVREQIVAGRARVGLIIPADFTADLLAGRSASMQVLIDGSESSVATNALQTARAISQLEALGRAHVDVEQLAVDIRPRLLFNPDLDSSNFYVPGVVGIVLQLVTLMLTSFAIVRERERGTLEQLAVTPISRPALMLGKLTPYAMIGMLQVLIALGVMRVVFAVPIAGSLPLLLALSFLFLLSALSMGILISTVAHNQAEAMQRSMMILLPSILLSGFAFPRETMPPFIYWISNCIPVTYYIQILRGIILRGAGLQHLWPQTLVLCGFAVVLVTASALRFHKRID